MQEEDMTEKAKFTLLKFEGVFFAIAMIFFTVMYYFGFFTKYVLIMMICFFSAVLFSINATVQGVRNSKVVEKFNIFISFLLFLPRFLEAVFSGGSNTDTFHYEINV